MIIEFESEIWYWRGPSPFHFMTVPAEQCAGLKAISGLVTYGWGMIPATVQIGETRWKTSLFPKDGGYIVPIKALAQKAEDLNVGDSVMIRIEIGI